MKMIFVEVEQLLLLNENNFVEICSKVVEFCNTLLTIDEYDASTGSGSRTREYASYARRTLAQEHKDRQKSRLSAYAAGQGAQGT